MKEKTAFVRFDIPGRNDSSWDDTLLETQNILSYLENLGITTARNSRIGKYFSAYESFLEVTRGERNLDLSLALKMLNAQVEIHMLKKIVKAAEVSSNADLWKQRLIQITSGAESPIDESSSASARDFQFESFIGAVCELSGYGVSFDEPDLVIRDSREVFSIAAKRPRNEKNIEKNIKKAIRQIREAKIPSLVALDISFALQPEKCINTNDISGVRLMVEHITDRFVMNNYKLLRQLCSGEYVIGVLIHLIMPALNYGYEQGTQLATGVRWAVAPFKKPHRKYIDWCIEFSKRCEVGLFDPNKNLGAR